LLPVASMSDKVRAVLLAIAAEDWTDEEEVYGSEDKDFEGCPKGIGPGERARRLLGISYAKAVELRKPEHDRMYKLHLEMMDRNAARNRK
jgi:hypothetical protein